MAMHVPSSLVLVALVPCAFPSAPAAQVSARSADSPSSRVQLFEGFVLAPDGAPAAGAVVVSSAGGRAVTGPDGSYRLEVEVPSGAQSVQLTAVSSAGRRLVANASVALDGMGSATGVEALLLSNGACSPSWVPTFGGLSGADADVFAFTTFDDGTGPALYVGGDFDVAGVAANRIAKWDGTSWAALGGGMNDTVRSLVEFDDGSGPALHAAGAFLNVGGVNMAHVARWDGVSWSALGSGTNLGANVLAVYDDGSGPALYAGGSFTTAGGVSASRIARWDGSSWSALGSGMGGGIVEAMAVFDDGNGPALYAGGTFTSAGGVTLDNIARWDGSSWSAVGGGTGSITALAVHDDGSGPALYAGGAFGITKWDGSSWSPLAGTSAIRALAVHDDGGGPVLYAGGTFTTVGGVAANRVARWDGSSWSALGSGVNNQEVNALASFDDGGGAVLYVGGTFSRAGGVDVYNIAGWDGSSWSKLGIGTLDYGAHALLSYDDGDGLALYAAGSFSSAGGVAADSIAKWDGSSWSTLGSGLSGQVHALAVYDDGSGPALHAAGSFSTEVAKWDGSSWSALGSGSGLNGTVNALAVHDDGGGSALYAGGWFTKVSALTVNYIAKWDGASWSTLGSGMNNRVYSLAVWDDGGGPALYAGGDFTAAGGVAANRIAKWDGATWSGLGSGMSASGVGTGVVALAVYDDGGGPALYAGGGFSNAGGVSAADRVAKWDGTSWSALGSGTNGLIHALSVYDDGSGLALFAGGDFTSASGTPASRIASWDGSSWSALDSGVSGSIRALAVHDDGSGPALFAAGLFAVAYDSGDSFIAKWGYPDDVDPPELSCPSFVDAMDALGSSPGEVVTFSVTASDCRDPAPVVVCVPPSGSFFPRGTTIVTCTATDASGNQSTCQFPVTVSLKARRR